MQLWLCRSDEGFQQSFARPAECVTDPGFRTGYTQKKKVNATSGSAITERSIPKMVLLTDISCCIIASTARMTTSDGVLETVAIQRAAGILHPTCTTKVVTSASHSKKNVKRCKMLQNAAKPCLEIPNPAKKPGDLSTLKKYETILYRYDYVAQ